MRPSILVTGGSGFVGAHVVKTLAEAGVAVIDFSAAPATPAMRHFLRDHEPLIARFEGDVREPSALSRAFEAGRIETVIHAAAINGEDEARAAPERTIQVNLVGTANVVACAAAAKVRRVLYLGSGTQYGPRQDVVTPIREDEAPSPQGIYAATKQAAETIGAGIAERAGIRFVALRISAPYGPLENIAPTPMHVRFWCEAGLADRNVELPSGGNHPRDLIYVSDVARAIAAVCFAPELRHATYNISGGKQTTIGDVVRALKRALPHAHLSLGGGFLGGDDPRVASSLRGPLDIGRIAEELGFAPEIGLAEGIRRYLEWLRRHSNGRAHISG